ncbi:MAG: restriction endonuclease subunit S [Methylococcales bacterium]|nr:restriction endonuclease subunit S [Methylococcales bacterium]
MINRGEIEGRLDSSSYHPERIKIIHQLQSRNWELKPLKLVASFSKNIVSVNPENLPYIGLENIESNTGFYVETSEKESFGTAVKFKKNQVLFPKLRPYLNKVHLADFEGLCSTEFHILDSTIVDNRYLSHFLRLNLVVNQTKYLMSGNTLPRLQTADIENLLIPVLPTETQAEIINIFETAESSKKQKEAEAAALLASIDGYLLQELGITLPPPSEKKTYFLTRSSQVSGGRFDPFYYQNYFEELNCSLENCKYSLLPLKKLASFKSGYAFNSTEYVDDSNCSLITIKNINKNSVDLSSATLLPDSFYDKYSAFQVKKGDLLIAMTGATIGKVGIYESDKKSLLNQRNGIIRPTAISNGTFLMNVLNIKWFQDLIIRNSNGGAQPNISETDIMRIKIPLPPLEKQTEITNHISAIRTQAKQLQQQAAAELAHAKQHVEHLILGE